MKKVDRLTRGSKKKDLSQAEIQKLLAEIDELDAKLAKKEEEAKAQDPFWFFEPSDGVLDAERQAFIEKYLKPDDVPQALDGQMDVLMSVAPIRAASGGNQSGKSTVGAIEAYIVATGQVPRAVTNYPAEKLLDKAGKQLRVVGVDNRQLMNTVIPTYQKWAPRDYLLNRRWKDSFSSEQKKLFLFKPGTDELLATIEFRTNEQDVDSFQGPPLDMVIYDEEPKEAIHKENLMRFTTAEKMNILFCFTPTHGLSWATDLFGEDIDEMGNETELFKLVSVTNKKANLQVLGQILENITDYQELKMRLTGEFVSLSGLVYGKLFDKKLHVVEPFFEHLDAGMKKEYLCVSGWDPHLVTSSAGVFLLVDREGNHYVDRCFFKDADTEELKSGFWEIVEESGYRMGWSVADKSSNSSITAFGGRNIFREISRGRKAIPGLRTSEKFEGSIKAGVDEIKKRLKIHERSGKPRFFIVNRPENKVLINSFRTLERETYANEDIKGPKDRIKEGKHHLHASLRYIYQYPISWYPEVVSAPEPEFFDEAAGW